MTQHSRLRTAFLAIALAVVGLCPSGKAQAMDLKFASLSPLTGLIFEDRPFALPVERNFQMALLAASSELGRSCGKMEAYGWRMNRTEQQRVNNIFTNAIDRLSVAGYQVEPGALKLDTHDITLFTADRTNKHFIFLWAAGEPGLVLNICETNAPMALTHRPGSVPPAVQVFPLPQEDPAFPLETTGTLRRTKPPAPDAKFSPVGNWVGGYTCPEGYFGGRLEIGSLSGENFKGTFKFFSTDKDPSVPSGSYTVYGQYDGPSRRILINPGKWVKKPAKAQNTVIVGSFDSSLDAFSGFFQGLEGCTSFEAHREKKAAPKKEAPKKAKAAKAPAKKKAAAPEKVDIPAKDATTDFEIKVDAVSAAPVAPVDAAVPVPGLIDPK